MCESVGLVVDWRVVFGVVIRPFVPAAFVAVVTELFLGFSALEPP